MREMESKKVTERRGVTEIERERENEIQRES